MATVAAIVTAIQARLTGLSGVVHLPATPPENLASVQLPAVVVFPLNGSWDLGAASPPSGSAARNGHHTIAVDLHIQRSDLALNIATALPYADSIPQRLVLGFRADRFDGTVQNMPEIRYELTELNWGGMQTLAWRFSVDVLAYES